MVALLLISLILPGVPALATSYAVSGGVSNAATVAPIPGATVVMWQSTGVDAWTWIEETTTDAFGAYHFTTVPGAGLYRVEATAEGFVVGSTIFEDYSGSPLDVDIELMPLPPISGTVSNADTVAPIPGATVVMWQDNGTGGWTSVEETTTDDAGVYEFATVPGSGLYHVEATAEGYAVGSTIFEDYSGWPLDVDIELNPWAPLTATGVAGDTRYETAIKSSQLAFPEDGSAETVLIASGENFPDALGGAALAGVLNAPVLLTESTSLPDIVANEIARLGASEAVIIGGTAAVSSDVQTAIEALPGVTARRIEGANRYDTAAKVADETIDLLGEDFGGTVLLATGEMFPDALAAAPLAAAGGCPILLVTRDAIPDETAAVLDGIAEGHGIVLGGIYAVSADVFSQLDAGWFAAGSLDRVAGDNRYDTAAKLAQLGVDDFGLSWNRVGFATGTNFPDALAGGTAQGLTGSVVLLTKPTSLEPQPDAKITTNAGDIYFVRYFGGTSAINDSVRDLIEAHILANKP